MNSQCKIFSALLALCLTSTLVCAQTADSDPNPSYNKAYFLLDDLNSGLPARSPSIHLQTPQATLEHFLRACREQQFMQAAQALNLNLIAAPMQALRAAELARQLYYVIEQKLWIDWEDLSDRPDGQIDVGATNNPLIGVPRRSLKLGSIELDGRDAAIRLQRVKLPEQEPIWVFSAATVENIDELYALYGPGFLQQHLPDWAKQRVLARMPLWKWLALFVFAALSGLIAWVGYRLTRRAIQHAEQPLLARLGAELPKPVGFLAGLLSFSVLNATILALTGPVAKVLTPLLTLLIVAGFTWLGIRLIRQLSVYVDQRYADRLEHYDDDEARRALTYVAVARRVLIFIALLVGVGIALSQLNLLKTLGISLLASAGLISVVAGVAAHNVLENIMAGIQIAITRPASIGDSIYFEKQWGYVEEITYTYITVRTWDQRRVVVPLKYFLSHPFENWSMRDPHLIKPIYLYVDYSTDVQALREKFEQLLQASEDWDKKSEPTVQVTACKEETMEVRVLCSAKNPSIAWDLHCRLREELIQYIQETERGRYLPKQRVLLEKSDNDKNPSQTAA